MGKFNDVKEINLPTFAGFCEVDEGPARGHRQEEHQCQGQEEGQNEGQWGRVQLAHLVPRQRPPVGDRGGAEPGEGRWHVEHQDGHIPRRRVLNSDDKPPRRLLRTSEQHRQIQGAIQLTLKLPKKLSKRILERYIWIDWKSKLLVKSLPKNVPKKLPKWTTLWSCLSHCDYFGKN